MPRILTNTIWKTHEPLVQAAKRTPVGAKPELPEREFLEAVLFRARTGTPWRELPKEFGDWNAVYQRAKRWRLAGVWERLFASLPPGSPLLQARKLFVDAAAEPAHDKRVAGKSKKAAPKKKEANTRGGAKARKRR